MTEFMSIKDVAEYLEVDYKTVYRLVRRGEIPSSQVGRVYRIRKADVETYLADQRLAQAKVSSVPSLRTVQMPPLRCASCLRLLHDENEIGGVCETEGCNAPICTICWSRDQRHTCPDHAPSQSDRLAAARSQLDEGKVSVLVTALQACQREQAYISRFDAKVQKITRLRHPISGQIITPTHSWAELRETSDQADELMELLRTGFLAADIEQTLPLNRSSGYRIPVKDGNRKALILAVRLIAHLPALIEQGFDTQPATAQEATRLLDEAIRKAESEASAILVGLASPTGWSQEARNYVVSGEPGRTFYHPAVLPYLVDLDRMSIAINPGDDRLAPMAPLFAPLLLEEGIAQAIEYIKRMLRTTGRVFISEISRDTGLDIVTIGQAFARLVQSGEYAAEDDPAFGKAIARTRQP